MLARVQSFLLVGIDALACEVEIHADEAGMTRETIVGLPDAAVKESLERVRSALLNSGYAWPQARVLINLAPADVRKEGPLYDLPIAVGLLAAQGVIRTSLTQGTGSGVMLGRHPASALSQRRGGLVDGMGTSGGGTDARGGWKPGAQWTGRQTHADVESGVGEERTEAGDARERPGGLVLRDVMMAGELALDGRLRAVRGAIAMADLARSRGVRTVIVPAENAPEAAVVTQVEAIGARTLAEVVGLLNGDLSAEGHAAPDVGAMLGAAKADVDFGDVRGQESVKRAITIAAAGGHNVIMLGPAGTGKTMMAKALPGILPALTPEEAVEVTRVHSAAGLLTAGSGLVTVRPVRSPHHTASAAAIIGGGVVPRPGEVSLAHHGVLFLDELAEFPRVVLETLRQPLEDHVVTIARSHSTVRFPASFMLVAAMNPTPKGDVAAGEVGRRAMEAYLSKLSGPLLDRIDIHVEAPAVSFKHLSGTARGTTSAQMRERVVAARAKAAARQGATANARLSGRVLDRVAPMEPAAVTLLGQAITELGLSARAYDKLRRVSRTIADLEGRETINAADVSEAVQYRLLDRRV